MPSHAFKKAIWKKLNIVEKLTILGHSHSDHRGGVISFIIKGAHAHDIASLVGEYGVCIRAGHHCAAPLHNEMNLPASCRLSIAVYNSKEDIDALIDALKYAKQILKI